MLFVADRTDVLSRLLIGDPGQSDEELRDHLVTLLLAGHETTSHALTWTLYLLSQFDDADVAAVYGLDDPAPYDLG